MTTMIMKDPIVDGAVDVAPALDEMVLRGQRLLVTTVDVLVCQPLKTQHQVEMIVIPGESGV